MYMTATFSGIASCDSYFKISGEIPASKIILGKYELFVQFGALLNFIYRLALASMAVLYHSTAS